MQPTADCYNLPAQMPALSLEPPSLVITMRNRYTTRAHGIGAIVGVHVRAPELANAAQLSSGGRHGAVLQTQSGNGSDGGAERARCQ